LKYPFWQKDNLITLILFELCLFWYLSQLQIWCTTLYVHILFKDCYQDRSHIFVRS
jgi:hypothetical protein